jgi:hypothetical protein
MTIMMLAAEELGLGVQWGRELRQQLSLLYGFSFFWK